MKVREKMNGTRDHQVESNKSDLEGQIRCPKKNLDLHKYLCI